SKPDINALASRKERSVTGMLWNYHDDDLPAAPADIDLTVAGLGVGRVLVTHYRVDGEHSNSYEAWKKMGSPPMPSAEQYRQLEQAGQLQLAGSPEWRTTADGKL